jgi:hypothetical protein
MIFVSLVRKLMPQPISVLAAPFLVVKNVPLLVAYFSPITKLNSRYNHESSNTARHRSLPNPAHHMNAPFGL